MENNNTLIPIAVGQHGEFGSLFRRFLEGETTLKYPPFNADRPNAHIAAQRAISTKTPFDVLRKADKNWKRNHNDKLFGGLYTAQSPSIWANQQLGLITQTHIATHIKASFTKMRFGNTQKPSQTLTPDDEEYGGEWKMFEGPLNDDIYYDDLHGLQESLQAHLDTDTDVLMDARKSKLHMNHISQGRQKGATTSCTFDAG